MSRFIDPVAQVIFKDSDTGAEWHLGSPQLPFLESVTLVYAGTMLINSIEVGIDMPYEFGMRWLDDLDKMPFKHQNYLKARIGYATGGWTEWEYGVLNQGGHGLTVTPDGVSGRLAVTHIPMKPAGYTLSQEVFEGAGYDAEKLVTAIAEVLGCGVDITEDAKANLYEYSFRVGTSVDSPEQNAAPDYFGGLSSKGAWDVLKTMCMQSDCLFFTRTVHNRRVMVVCTERDMTLGNLMVGISGLNKYVIRGILAPEKGQYPAYSFAPQEDANTWLAGASAAASGVQAYGHDTTTGEDVEFDILPEDQEDAQVGNLAHTRPVDMQPKGDGMERVVIDTFKNDGSLGTFLSAPIPPGGSEIFKKQALSMQRAGNPGIKGDISTVGVPDERVANLCSLSGASRLYNDTYYIEKLTHEWVPGSWTMKLGVHRRGTRAKAGDKQAAAVQMPTEV